MRECQAEKFVPGIRPALELLVFPCWSRPSILALQCQVKTSCRSLSLSLPCWRTQRPSATATGELLVHHCCGKMLLACPSQPRTTQQVFSMVLFLIRLCHGKYLVTLSSIFSEGEERIITSHPASRRQTKLVILFSLAKSQTQEQIETEDYRHAYLLVNKSL